MSSSRIVFSTSLSFFFFFNATATTEIYTLSLHDALPISGRTWARRGSGEAPRSLLPRGVGPDGKGRRASNGEIGRATSELQSPDHLVCRLLLEKKKKKKKNNKNTYTTIIY